MGTSNIWRQSAAASRRKQRDVYPFVSYALNKARLRYMHVGIPLHTVLCGLHGRTIQNVYPAHLFFFSLKKTVLASWGQYNFGGMEEYIGSMIES